MGAPDHTPGPWKWERGNLRSSDACDVLDAGGRVVGCHDEADARLIAAAPDLLEVVRQWVRLWDGDHPMLYDEAQAAIRKATGGDK